jgi:hypothetical protein
MKLARCAALGLLGVSLGFLGYTLVVWMVPAVFSLATPEATWVSVFLAWCGLVLLAACGYCGELTSEVWEDE